MPLALRAEPISATLRKEATRLRALGDIRTANTLDSCAKELDQQVATVAAGAKQMMAGLNATLGPMACSRCELGDYDAKRTKGGKRVVVLCAECYLDDINRAKADAQTDARAAAKGKRGR